MADEIIIETTSTEVVEVGVPGPQGPAGAAGTGLETLTSQGDTLYRGASTGERLPIGTTGQVLKVSAQGLPTWANESGAVTSVNGQTGAVTVAAATHGANHYDSGDLIYNEMVRVDDAGFAGVNGVYYVADDGGEYDFIKIGSRSLFKLVFEESRWKFKRQDATYYQSQTYANAPQPWNATGWTSISSQNNPAPSVLQADAVYAVDNLARNTQFASGLPVLGSAGNLPVKTGSGGVIEAGSFGVPVALAETASEGTSSSFARADHVHALPTANQIGALSMSGNLGDIDDTAEARGNLGLGTASTKDVAPSGNASSTQVVLGNDTRLSDARTPSSTLAHAASHYTGGSDQLRPQDIGAQSIFETETVTWSSDLTLTASRAKQYNAIVTANSNITLPTSGHQVGDVVVIYRIPTGNGTLAVLRGNPSITSWTVNFGEQFRWRATGTGNADWELVRVDSHSADRITSGTLDIARLPTGTGSTQIALGNHTHTPADVGLSNVSNTAQVTSVTGTAPIVSSGGTTPAISITDATTSAAGSMSAADKTKLDGIATGATANSSDATLLNRANHTGTQAANTITGLAAIATSGSASDLGSGTVPIARLGASGTPSGSTYLAGDNTWKAAGGVTTGSVDNAVLRADGTGGSTSQSSDINILDATTSTQNNVAITNEHSGQTNSSLVLGTKGTGAFIVSTARPDGTSTGGNARGASAICIQAGARSANTNVASGLESVAVGKNTRAANNYAIAIGSGTYAAATAVAIGYTAGNDGVDSVAIGDRAYSNTRSVSVGQLASYANTTAEVVTLGYQTNSSVARGIVVGYDVTNTLRGAFATNAFRAAYWGGTTTDATANVVLNMDATATNRFTIAANTMVVADILIAANSTASGKASFWHYHVAIRRDGSNNTALVGSAEQIGTTQTVGSPSGWSVALTADDTNEALQLAVTGEASTSITWRATAFYRLV